MRKVGSLFMVGDVDVGLALSAYGDVLDRDRRLAAWTAWHTAALGRRGKGPLPSIDQLLGIKLKVVPQTAEQMKAAFASIRQSAA